jgi:5-methylcytosine-specific restriction endonuclease McrA
MFELDRLVSYDDDALLAELRRVAALVDSPYLTASAFDKNSKAHSSGIRRRFGGWQQALARAGLENRYSGTPAARRIVGRTFTDEQLLAELRAVSAKIAGKPVTVEVFNQHADINAETVRRRFGSWWAALKHAGLEISSLGRRYSDANYFENLLAVWTHYGRQPTYGEMDQPPSSIPPGAYEAKWGTWRKALIAFLERVNSDTCQEETEPPPIVEEQKPRSVSRQRSEPRRVKDEDQRQIKLGLRYEVLKRDRFRCVLCGASPATHLGCVLHVDHIIPWSKGGKTVADNLRSLCETCNLGKSAKLEGKAG